MGQFVSSNSTEVTINHVYAEEPPSGWIRNGSVMFHANSGDQIRDLLHNINTYRSPSNQIVSLRDIRGNVLPDDTHIPQGKVIYFV